MSWQYLTITKHNNMHRYHYVLFLFVIITTNFTGCKEEKNDVQKIYNEYRFDSTVIQKIALYEMFVKAVQANHAVFKAYTTSEGNTRAFRYMPTSTDIDVYKKLPPEISNSVDSIYNLLGGNYIKGFDIYPDSTIKIYIRRTMIEKTSLNIDEYLSYLPPGKTMRKREYPMKDSMLNQSWQFWISVNDQGIF